MSIYKNDSAEEFKSVNERQEEEEEEESEESSNDDEIVNVYNGGHVVD